MKGGRVNFKEKKKLTKKKKSTYYSYTNRTKQKLDEPKNVILTKKKLKKLF